MRWPAHTRGCSSQLAGTDLNRDCDDLDLVLQVFNVRAARYALEHPHAATARATAETGIPQCVARRAPDRHLHRYGGGVHRRRPVRSRRDMLLPAGKLRRGHRQEVRPETPVFGAGSVFPATVRHLSQGLGRVSERGRMSRLRRRREVHRHEAGHRAPGPTARERNAGAKVLVAAGRCVEPLVQSCATSDCPAGSVCRQQQCERRDAPCRTDADCPAGTCRSDVVTATAEDTDGDEVPDVVDNCPFRSNPDQADDDGNHVGNECEVALAACPSEATVGTLSCRVDALDGAASQCLLDARFRGKLDKLVRRMQATLLRAERSSERAAGLRRVRHDLRSYRRLLASRRGREVLASTGCDDLVARTEAIAGAVAALLDAEPYDSTARRGRLAPHGVRE